ncbi:MAG: hypothetical protein LKF36_04990 [Lactobacillus sp.]|nr:hypothetical protein [Lactobacillus sp.]
MIVPDFAKYYALEWALVDDDGRLVRGGEDGRMLLKAGAPLKVQEAYAAYIELLDYQLENNIDF